MGEVGVITWRERRCAYVIPVEITKSPLISLSKYSQQDYLDSAVYGGHRSGKLVPLFILTAVNNIFKTTSSGYAANVTVLKNGENAHEVVQEKDFVTLQAYEVFNKKYNELNLILPAQYPPREIQRRYFLAKSGLSNERDRLNQNILLNIIAPQGSYTVFKNPFKNQVYFVQNGGGARVGLSDIVAREGIIPQTPPHQLEYQQIPQLQNILGPGLYQDLVVYFQQFLPEQQPPQPEQQPPQEQQNHPPQPAHGLGPNLMLPHIFLHGLFSQEFDRLSEIKATNPELYGQLLMLSQYGMFATLYP